jgi:hypothetical protein
MQRRVRQRCQQHTALQTGSYKLTVIIIIIIMLPIKLTVM